MPTVSRHEVSRWEREERVPGSFWLGWLAVVLDFPLAGLEAAVAATRRVGQQPVPIPPEHRRLWRAPQAGELLAALADGSTHDLRELAHTWLAGPPDPPAAAALIQTVQVAGSAGPDELADCEARLAQLRRMDDLIGGVDLAGPVDRALHTAIGLLRTAGPGRQRRVLRLVAGHAQLAGWVHADAGDPPAARRAYRVALRAAAAAGDRPLAAYVLGGLSHHVLGAGDPHEALLLARTALAGAAGQASALTRALLLQRVALALAELGERRASQAALAGADQAAGRSEPGREPPWLYWLDPAELAAMTGRCLTALGRPLRAASLLTGPRRRLGPRTAALYGSCLARNYLAVGEIEQACRVARQALRDAVAAGSVRATTGLRHLHPMLLRHRDLTAVRGYERIAANWAPYLPAPVWGRPGRGAGAASTSSADNV
jgi:hypothetical protein